MRRLRPLIAAVVTMVAGVLVLSATPAQAKPQQDGYAFMSHGGIGQTGYVDIDGVHIVICPQCYLWAEFIADQPDPVLKQLNQELLLGVQDLGYAASATDPAVRQRYRTAALAAFGSAAQLTVKTGIRAGAVGYYDAAKGVTVPKDYAWLAAAAQDIVDGVTVLAQSPTLPLPPPRLGAVAMAQFDEAYTELVTERPIAG